MEKKTHIACANLITLYFIKPITSTDLLTTVAFATLGALLPDVDLKDSTSDKIFDRLMTSLITILVIGIAIKYIFDINLYYKIKESNIFNYLISICGFIIMSYLGSKTNHRSFTHSILGLLIYTFILSYSFSHNIITVYFLSHLSHIVLDLFNMKGLMLFYPFKSRISLKLCESNGTVNKLLFTSFSILIIIVLIIIGTKL